MSRTLEKQICLKRSFTANAESYGIGDGSYGIGDGNVAFTDFLGLKNTRRGVEASCVYGIGDGTGGIGDV